MVLFNKDCVDYRRRVYRGEVSYEDSVCKENDINKKGEKGKGTRKWDMAVGKGMR